jgi:hypothetical protein
MRAGSSAKKIPDIAIVPACLPVCRARRFRAPLTSNLQPGDEVSVKIA